MNLKLSERDEALEVALSSKDRLQDALSSAKHGISGSWEKSVPLDLRSLLRCNSSDVYTITIDHNSTKLLTLHRWYCVCNVLLKDVYKSMRVEEQVYVVELDSIKMDLYSLTAIRILQGLIESIKGKCSIKLRGNSIVSSLLPSDVLNRYVRKGKLNRGEESWKVYENKGDVYTSFKGNVFDSVAPYVDVVLSTNIEITVSRIGKVKALHLYKKYLREDDNVNTDVYLSNMFCANTYGCNDYYTMAKEYPLKRLGVREQEESLLSFALNKSVDNMSSKQSKLLLGVDLG